MCCGHNVSQGWRLKSVWYIAADGWQFGSGHNGNSVCPSLACLDVKMYNFLNSEACICTVQDLKSIHNYATDAQGHLKLALIGAQSTQCYVYSSSMMNIYLQ